MHLKVNIPQGLDHAVGGMEGFTKSGDIEDDRSLVDAAKAILDRRLFFQIAGKLK